ncbi:swarming motility protein SwrB [Robertmurraya siralis]|uniref:Swarming motility protein SwrB n=1 Tax=Robertmurraya siralis TaxID=77777 RepID=A0A919WGW6_9BACI|nr:hypothetical protein [Robertmurraya siralis]GIN61554.1 swarming motility protein SwrB [Robertmurraya siralis]
MTNLFLFISLILNIVALFCIVILYLRQNRLLVVEKRQEEILKEIEEVISSYLIEMTEENEKFIEKLSQVQSKTEAGQGMAITEQIDDNIELNKERVQLEKGENITYRKGTVFQAVKAYRNVNGNSEEKLDQEKVKPNLENKEAQREKIEDSDDINDESVYHKAILLQKQGLSIEDIAKKLGKGKTELELLFKLRQNEKE